MTSEAMARDILAAPSRAALRALFAEWRGRYVDQELLDDVERLKDEQCDQLLSNDLHTARRLAACLTLLGREVHLPYIEGLGTLAQADAARRTGRLRVAMVRFLRAGELFLASGSPIGWARARGGWVAAASDNGAVTSDDLAAMDEACQVLRDAGAHRRLANVHQNIALAYANLSRFQDALRHWQHALDSLKRSSEPEARQLEAIIQNNLALMQLWQGDFAGAYARHVAVRVLFRELERYGNATLVDLKLSVIEQERGHLAEALRLVTGAQEEAVARHLHNTAALARLHHAKLLLRLNRLDEAATASGQALEALSAQHDAHDLVDALCTHAEALARIGDRTGALRSLEQAEAAAGGRDHPHTYRIALERAALLLQPGKGSDAAMRTALAREARALAREIADRSLAHDVVIHHRMALLLEAEAMLALELGSEAEHQAQQLLAQGVAAIGPEVAYRCQLMLARVARSQGRAAEALAHYGALVGTLSSFVQELAYDRRADFLEDKDAVYLEALTTALDAHEPARALTYLERQRARGAWLATSGGDDELERLRREHRGVSASLLSDALAPSEASASRAQLRSLDHAIAERVAARARLIAEQTTVDASAMLGAVPPGSALVAYALVGEDLAIFVLAQRRIAVTRVPGALARLRTHSRHLRARLEAYGAAPRSSDRRAAASGVTDDPDLADVQADLRGLWSVLLEPVAGLLPADGSKLFFVPHKELHALPLAALYDGARYVAERWVTACLPSCHALTQHDQTASVLDAPAGNTASRPLRSLVALGYAGAAGALPQVTREAVRVAEQTGGMALVGERATLAHLRDEAPLRGYVHIAAHGAVRLDIPNSSFVELADGLFHPLDALTLPLADCQLVVLSACETGRGKSAGGDDQVGLVRAFGLAGARAVIATLWRVDDVASMVLMELFYERLAAEVTPAAALGAAQRAFIAGAGGSALRSPYYWASYQLMAFQRAD